MTPSRSSPRYWLMWAILLAGVMAMDSTSWAVVLDALILLVLIYIDFVRPAMRRYALKNPCRVYFMITSKDKFALGYVDQDQLEHFVDTLVLPANKENIFVELTIRANTDFTIKRIVFGVGSTELLDAKPYATSYYQRHIMRGVSSFARPESNDNHSLDSNYQYQMKTEIDLVTGAAHNPGFYINTRKPGTYKVTVRLLGQYFDCKAPLTIRVEEKPDALIPCIRSIDHDEHPKCEKQLHFHT